MASSSTSVTIEQTGNESEWTNYKYPYPCQVNAVSFMSIKLSSVHNYDLWREQMICLLESHDMLGFIDGALQNPKKLYANNNSTTKEGENTINCTVEAKYREWKRSDTLVKGWIFGSLSESPMSDVVGLQTANDVWEMLKPTNYTTPPTINTRPGGTTSAGTDYEYPYPCHVNTASFVSIKLSSIDNYDVWQKQMMCLIESHNMLGFIDGTLKNPKEEHADNFNKAAEYNTNSTVEAKYREWKRSDTLVKGWIFGSLSENYMRIFVGLDTANDVWEKLKTSCTTPSVHINTMITTSSTTTIKKDMGEYIPLYRAIIKMEWEKAQEIFNQDKDALTAELDRLGNRALHIAIHKAESIQLVRNLLNMIHPESLPTLVNILGWNPLHHAALIDNTKAANILVEKNPCLLFISDQGLLPIHRACINSHRRTFLYLLDACKKHILLSQQDGCHTPFEGQAGALFLCNTINSGFYDFASLLINNYPHMARTIGTADDNLLPLVPLLYIANKWDSFHSETRYNLYQRLVYASLPIKKKRLHDTITIQDIENQKSYKANCLTNCKRMETYFYYVPHAKQLQEEKVKHEEAVLLVKSICEEVVKINIMSDIIVHYESSIVIAAYNDTPEVVEQLIEYFPAANWVADTGGYNLFQIAIKYRCEKVYNFLLCHMSHDQYLLQQNFDKDYNNPLHLVAQLAPTHKLNRVSGAALQMQRELQWFNDVRNFVKPMYKDRVNKAGETPIMVFRREHNELRKDGEEWMKKTADSYTIVAALIITIVFAAAITVPGGNNGDNGKAIYETKPSFIVFAVSDAISLFSSTTSLLLFLSILTARYQEEDFLYRLPKRLILGLTMLFLSVTSMMVAFSATLYLMFGQEEGWILIPIATLTCLPIASFVTLQLPLLVDMISSTYGQGIFAKQSDRKMKQS